MAPSGWHGATLPGAGVLAALLCALAALLPAPPLAAQAPDTSRVLGFGRPEPGAVVGDTLPAATPALDAPALLAAVPGSFVYAFGAFGWPGAWSPSGLDPQRLALTLDGRPFDDLVTGRPRYDLLPLAFLDPLQVAPARQGAPLAVHARLRAYDEPRPLTEMRYWGGGTLQSIQAMHHQQRRPRLFGRPGRLGVLFGYGGHAAANEYPGSRLRRQRQVLARVRYAQARWAAEALALHNRHRLGAHGGVVPRGAFETIYERFGAQVENPDARRKTLRTDLALTLHAQPVRSMPPLAASVFWTAQTFEYRDPGADTLRAEADRYGVTLRQALSLGAHRLHLAAGTWTDRLSASNALPAGLSRRRAYAALLDSLRFGGFEAVFAVDLTLQDERSPGGQVHLAREVGPVRLFAAAWRGAQPVGWLDTEGFGPFVLPAAQGPSGTVTQAQTGFSARAGPFDLTAFGFVQRTTEPLDLYVVAGDTVAARVATDAFERVGAVLDVGFRRDARRGLYLAAQPTALRFRNAGASPEHARQQAVHPEWYGQARLGLRYRLFRGDLDLDASLRGRYWSAFRSRTLHPPTGLLVIPPSGARPVDPSAALDLVLEGGVRTARLFLVWENILSGVAFTGNLIVPVYPLPERRLRFGVYWPILN